jgi:hypothetical protein
MSISRSKAANAHISAAHVTANTAQRKKVITLFRAPI